MISETVTVTEALRILNVTYKKFNTLIKRIPELNRLNTKSSYKRKFYKTEIVYLKHHELLKWKDEYNFGLTTTKNYDKNRTRAIL